VVTFILAFILSGAQAQTIAMNQLRVGRHWVWRYSEFHKETGTWVPYLDERYTVVDVKGTKVTVEMSSTEAGKEGAAPAHHKFVFDYKNCELAGRSPAFRHWTLSFYSKSLAADWALVSGTHPNYVFTEKFNCSKTRSAPEIEAMPFEGRDWRVFRELTHSTEESGWYFLDHPRLQAVSAQKFFAPDGAYRFQFLTVSP
jgi:hypothetical protein